MPNRTPKALVIILVAVAFFTTSAFAAPVVEAPPISAREAAAPEAPALWTHLASLWLRLAGGTEEPPAHAGTASPQAGAPEPEYSSLLDPEG